jgi:hypothetical protein
MATPSRRYDRANVGGCDTDHDRPFVAHDRNPIRRVETSPCTLMATSLPQLWFAVPVGGRSCGTRFGNLEVRPLGGGLGCLFMVLFSAVASVVLTVLINMLLR